MSFVSNVINDMRKTIADRRQMKGETELSSLAVNESKGYRLPVVYGNDSFLLSDKAAWAPFTIYPKPWGFLDVDTSKNYAHNAERFFSHIFPSDKQSQGHILVTNTVHSTVEWEKQCIANHEEDATANFAPYIRATSEAIGRSEFFERDTYMFVRMGKRGSAEGVRGRINRAFEWMLLGSGLEDTQPDDQEIEEWDDQADSIVDTISNSWIKGQPINRKRVEWLIRHLDTPALPTPDSISPADGETWGIGQWRTVLSSYTREIDLGRKNKNRYRAIEFLSPTGEETSTSYAAYLPLDYLPQEMAYSATWMHHSSKLDFPVDISVRFEVIDPDRAARMIQHSINAAEAQKEEDADAGVSPDDLTMRQQDSLTEVKRNVKEGREPITRWQAVFCVYDTSKEELRSKIQKLIDHYKDISIGLVNPPADQRELFYQSFPGGEIEVDDWIHRTNPKYLAFAQPWLSSNVGDNVGLYQGYTMVRDSKDNVRRGVPVFYDLKNLIDISDAAPTEAVAAESGSGKTVSRGLKSAYEDYHRGVTQFIWDPKGDFLSLKRYADWMRIDHNKIKLIDLYQSASAKSGTSVSLDPLGVAEVDYTDPDDPRDERAPAAVDVLKQFFNAALSHIVSNAETAGIYEMLVRNAVEREIAKEKDLSGEEIMRLRHNNVERELEDEPCLQGVMQTLAKWTRGQDLPELYTGGDDLNVRTTASLMLQALETAQRKQLGRLLLQRPSKAGSLNIEKGDLVLFVAINMNTTDQGEEPTEKTVLADIISGMMTDYIRSMLWTLPDSYTKSATFDEWHVIKRSARADALVSWLRRMGRSKRCMVRQMSQSARDHYDARDPKASRTSLATVWCGKVETDDEAEASCVLLGIEPTASNIATLMAMGKGQFLFRDQAGRVAFVQVEIIEDELLDRFNTSAKKKEEFLQALKTS